MILSVDTENDTYNKGAPFDGRFNAVCYSWADNGSGGAAPWNEETTHSLNLRVAEARVLVGFNLKYDLHVLRKFGIHPPENCTIWDCQLAEFVRSKQTRRYPSLNESLQEFGLGQKIDVVATEYWAKGVQTSEIPWGILSEYAEADARLTLKLYEAQSASLSPKERRLVKLQGQDLLVLQEMEWNGLHYNHELLETRAAEIEKQIHELTERLRQVYPDLDINFDSGDQLSAFLYGGQIKEEVRIHDGFFKTGLRAGQAKFRKEEVVHELPRLVTPIRGSELKKEGFFATNSDTLLKLRGTRKTKEIIEIIQRRTRLDSLRSKTYEGIRKVNEVQNWPIGVLHGQYNQCVAQTGRLSSSNPNLQNLDSEAADLFVSRYEN